MKNFYQALITFVVLFVAISSFGQKWDPGFASSSGIHIRDIIEYDGDLYVAGRWSAVGQTFIMKWDGTQWTAVGTGFTESTDSQIGIYSLEVFNGELYAGGWFTIDIGGTDYYGLVKWNGTSWSAITDFPNSPSSQVYDLDIFNSNIMIGGEFSGLFGGATTIENIIGHNGTNWVAFDEGVYDGEVLSMDEHNGEFYIAGKFNRERSTTNFMNNIAKWDGVGGEWVDIGNLSTHSNSGYFDQILSYGSHLYVYTIRDDIFNNFPQLIRWDLADEVTSINTVSVTPEYSRLAFLQDMIVFDGNLVVAGNYLDSQTGGNSSPIQIETYDGTAWNKQLPEGASADALGVFEGKLTNGYLVLNDPSIDISASETELCVNTITTFSYEDFSSNALSSITWTFEGGTPSSSTDDNPEVSYATAGTYDVSVSVTSTDGTTDLVFPDMITVGDDFSVDAGEDVTINYGDQLTLVGTPSGGTWTGTDAISGDNFDGGFSSGEFTVTYTVTQNGCTKEDSRVVTVEKNDPGAYDFSSIPDDLMFPVQDEITLPAISNATFVVVSGPVRFTNVTNAPAFVVDGAGEVTIEVTQPETVSTFERSDEFTFSVAKGDHTLTVNAIEDKAFGTVFTVGFGPGFDFQSDATTSSGLYDVNILSGPATADSETNLQEVTVTGVGTVSFEIVSLGNDNWNPAPTAQGTFEAVKATQTVTASPNLVDEYSFSNELLDFSSLVTSSTGLPVVFVITEGPGFFSGDDQGQYNFVSTGQVTLSAFASGNENYESSLSIEVVFTVIKGDQTITWSGFEEESNLLPSSITYNPDGFTPIAESDADLAIDYSVVNGEGSIDNGKFLITTSGSFTLRASQSGDDNWNEASEDYSFVVNKAEQTITFEAIGDKIRDDVGFAFAPTATSGLGVIVQSNTGRTSYDNSMITFNSATAGQEQLTLFQQGDANYLPANQQSLTFCISGPTPVLTVNFESSSLIEILSDNSIDTHEYFLDGTSIGTFGGGSVSFTEQGTYTAIALASDGCPSSEASNAIVYEVLGLNDLENISIYPNPTSGLLTYSSEEYVSLKLFGLNGQVIKVLDIPNKEHKMDLEDLSVGQYILHVYQDGKLLGTEKIIKRD